MTEGCNLSTTIAKMWINSLLIDYIVHGRQNAFYFYAYSRLHKEIKPCDIDSWNEELPWLFQTCNIWRYELYYNINSSMNNLILWMSSYRNSCHHFSFNSVLRYLHWYAHIQINRAQLNNDIVFLVNIHLNIHRQGNHSQDVSKLQHPHPYFMTFTQVMVVPLLMKQFSRTHAKSQQRCGP